MHTGEPAVPDWVLTQPALAELTGYQPEQTARIRQCLEQQGIRVFAGRDGIWTTRDAVNRAMLGQTETVEFA